MKSPDSSSPACTPEPADCAPPVFESPARRLRRLLARPGIVRSFAAHDVFSARVLEDAGVELFFLGGFGVSASVLGLPDVGLTTLSEMTEAARRMTERLAAPLIVDGDTGHGGPTNVARTVREFERAGAAGMLLEDQAFPKRCGHFEGKQVVTVDEMLARLDAALDARRDPNFVVIARTDARATDGLDRAIERAERYGRAGADLCFVEAPRSREELERVARETTFPQLANMLPGGATPLLAAEELQRLGFKIVVDPVSTLLASGFVLRRLAQAMLGAGRVDAADIPLLPFDEIKRLLGLEEFLGTPACR